jgi:hypothetical protein
MEQTSNMVGFTVETLQQGDVKNIWVKIGQQLAKKTTQI